MQSLLGRNGEPAACSKLVHWFKVGAKPGALCLCGAQRKLKGGKREWVSVARLTTRPPGKPGEGG
jgi:hypothetical protein